MLLILSSKANLVKQMFVRYAMLALVMPQEACVGYGILLRSERGEEEHVARRTIKEVDVPPASMAQDCAGITIA